MDLIFDIMSSGNYLNNKAEIDKNHNVVCAGREREHGDCADPQSFGESAFHVRASDGR